MKFEEFCLLISEISNIPLETIESQSSFRDDLNIDSLQLVNLIVEVSAKFGLEVTKLESIAGFQTVEKMYQMMVREGLVHEQSL